MVRKETRNTRGEKKKSKNCWMVRKETRNTRGEKKKIQKWLDG